MAIFHFTVKSISRSNGKSAVASAAYRRGERLYDQRLEQMQNYSKKQNVLYSALSIPDEAPDWLKKLGCLHATGPRLAAEEFWNRVEDSEKRQDAQIAREVEFALPIELDQAQCIDLAREFIQDQFVLRGMVADWSVHWEKGNPHVHVMLTMRDLTEFGFGKKNRDWNSKVLLNSWREKWAEYANFHLHMHQHDVRIDHRSYQEQGIELIPTVHQGRAVTDMHGRGIATDIMREASAVRRENLNRIVQDPKVLFKKLGLQSETFSIEQISQTVGSYIQDHGSRLKTRKIALNKLDAIFTRLTRHDAVFSEHDIARAVAHFTDDSELFARALIEIRQSGELLSLGIGSDGKERFTTQYIFKLENQLQDMTDGLYKHRQLSYRKSKIEKLLIEYQSKSSKKLTDEQLNAIRHMVKPSSIVCMIGKAGTGKSFTLEAAKQIWESQGLRVQGIALSGIAADGLVQSTGIPSRTIASFQFALNNNQIRLDKNDVVVMDEAGMTDTPSMHGILSEIKKAKAKLVLVGDPNQLQPIGPGASFRAILERTSFVELNTIYRQQDQWQREATQDLASGRIPKAVHAYAQKECLHIQSTEAQAMQSLVEDWLRIQTQPNAELQQSLVLAHRNDDVMVLNQLIRKARINKREIADGYNTITSKGAIKLSKGDRIMFLKNDRQLGVSNGRFAYIEDIHFTETGQLLSFTAKLDGTKNTLHIDPKNYKNFTYGYAATIHKSQGVTVDHTLIYVAGKYWNKHLTYVAMSRHRQSCKLYTSKEFYPDLQHLQQDLSKAATKNSIWDYPLAFAARRGIDAGNLADKTQQHLSKKIHAVSEQIKSSWQSLQKVQVKNQKVTLPLGPKYQAAIHQLQDLHDKCQQSRGQRNHAHYQNQLEKYMEKISRDKALFKQLQNQLPELSKKLSQISLEQEREG